jgi:hypothetical protein
MIENEFQITGSSYDESLSKLQPLDRYPPKILSSPPKPVEFTQIIETTANKNFPQLTYNLVKFAILNIGA